MKTVLAVMLFSSIAFAEPSSLKVKRALIESPSGNVVEVDGGIYLNDEGKVVVEKTINDLRAQVDAIVVELKSANDKIAECSGYVPGLPTWATILISSVLSIATTALGYFAISQVK